MILIIGGTTEGRTAVQVCDEAAKPYYYATKNASQQVDAAHAIRHSGALNGDDMLAFCQKNDIQLIIDAAHPFAHNVHRNIGTTARLLNLPIIRIERHFPPRHPRFHWVKNYDEAIAFLEKNRIHHLLALTGVNSVAPLKPYWEKHQCTFRIMRREESLKIVEKNKFPLRQILFYEDERDDAALFQRVRPQAILTKESGITGGFVEKTEAALAEKICIVAIERPPLPYEPAATVYGVHGLRKEIERQLPRFFELKTGYTTGSCATAAAKAATVAMLSGEKQTHCTIHLPNDEPIELPIAQTQFHENGSVTCCVIKDAGDDPDVTHGLEICATIAWNESRENIRFLQGDGVGRVTLPGLGLPIGAPAINATPREMIEREIRATIERLADEILRGIDVTISVPRGKEIAGRTFNPKLGIVDGISIIGTSGIVKPYSSEAFVASIQREVQVAKALGIERLVMNSGAKSEKQLKAYYPDLPPQAFVQYGNFIGETLRIADEEHFIDVTLGIMLGKAVKLAAGHLDTHSKKSAMSKAFIQSLAQEAGCSKQTIDKIGGIRIARELWDIVPEAENKFFHLLLEYCHKVCQPKLPTGNLTLLLIDEKGTIIRKDS